MAKASDPGASSSHHAPPGSAARPDYFLDSSALAALLGSAGVWPADLDVQWLSLEDFSVLLLQKREGDLPTPAGSGEEAGQDEWEFGMLMVSKGSAGLSFFEDVMPLPMPLDHKFIGRLHDLIGAGSERLFGVPTTTDGLDSWALFVMVPPTESMSAAVFTFG